MRANAAGYTPTPTPQGAQINAAVTPEDNGRAGVSTVRFWVGLLLLYLVWDWVVLRTKAKDIVNPGNIRTNVYNLFFIGIAAVIFINGFKVLLVKVAAWEIPGVSWVAERLLPLFQL